MKIIASGDLNEYKIRDLLAAGSPIDVFGVGTELTTSRDEPSLNTIYKLVEQETAGGSVGRFKLSAGKKTYPFAKQVLRKHGRDGSFESDLIARATERAEGEPLLEPILHQGRPVRPLPSISECQARFIEQRRHLTPALLKLEHAAPYPVKVSDELESELKRLSSS